LACVLFLGASVSQLDAIRTARDLGIRVVAVDGDPDAVGFRHADVAEVVDFSDVDAVVELGARQQVDGVLAVATDRAVPVAAAVAQRLGLPGLDPATAHAMTNKHAMRRQLAAAGLKQPRYALIAGLEDAADAFAAVGGSAVLKPTDSGGQRGVFVVESVDELQRRLPETLSHGRGQQAILEQYISGTELNGIVVVSDGQPHVITLSDRLRPPGLGFGVGWAHLFPSTLSPAVIDLAATTAAQAVIAAGMREGIGFPQLIATASEVYLIEVAARIPAGQMADLVQVGVGVDLFGIALRQALGERVEARLWQPKFRQPLAVRFFTASPGVLPVGRITAIRNLERVRTAPGVVKADLYMRPGEAINPVQVDADRRGYVIAIADDPRSALVLADEAALALEVDVEQPCRTDALVSDCNQSFGPGVASQRRP
jgi:biotin carboxylase